MEIKASRLIKFRHLSAFVEIIRTGSLKDAASRLGLTQPAISKTLKDLEEAVGAPLLTRGRAGVALTREGDVFFPFAEQSLAALHHGLSSLEAISAGATAPLKIGALPSVAASLLPDAIERFAALSPKTPVVVEDGAISILLDRMRTGDLDLVIGRLGEPSMMKGLSFTHLYSEKVVFAVAPDHPLVGHGDLDQALAFPVLYPPKDAVIRPLVDRFMIANGQAMPTRVVETVSGAFCRSMVLGPSQAVWVISEGVIARDIEAGRLVKLSIETEMTAGPVGVMARAEEAPTPPLRLFRQAVVAAAEG